MDLPCERAIPMMPDLIFGYLLIYVCLVLLYFLFNDYKRFKFAIGAYLWITTIHYAIFFLYPVRMVYRPELDGAPGWINTLTAWYFTLDFPNNCFPSLHVSYPFLGTLILWNWKRGWAWIFVAFTVIIATSVVLVKQHYILDAAGAMIVTSIGYWLYILFCKSIHPPT
jgi:membrane-associated phospholipid phosphatase